MEKTVSVNKTAVLAALCLLALLLAASGASAAQECTLKIRPNVVHIGTTYDGTGLSVTGTVPEGSSAVIRLVGDQSDKHFKRKGKALGLLWMNLDAVSIKDVPGVFLLGVDPAVYADGGDSWRALGLGFSAFQGDTDALVYDEFLKLKEREGLYQVQSGIVEYAAAAGGQRSFSASLALPSALRKGIFQVEVYAVRDGQVVCRASEELHVELTGFPAFLSSLAFDHSLSYGIMATVIAILAGLLMTIVFKDRGGAH